MFGFDEINHGVLVFGRVLEGPALDEPAIRRVAEVVARWSESMFGVLVTVPVGQVGAEPVPVVVGVRIAAATQTDVVPTGPFGRDHVVERAMIARGLPDAFWREVADVVGDAEIGARFLADPLETRLVASGRYACAAVVHGSRCKADDAGGLAFVRGHSPDDGQFLMQHLRMGAAGVEVARASHDGARLVTVAFDPDVHADRETAVASLAGEHGYHVLASYGAWSAGWRSPDAPPPAPPTPLPRAPVVPPPPPGVLTEFPFEDWTALHWAAWNGELDVVEQLLADGVDPNDHAADWSPLHLAVARGHDLVADALIDAGISVDESSALGLTPLHVAALYGRPEMVRKLFALGAQVDDANGWRPIHLAATCGLYATRDGERGRRPLTPDERAGFLEVADLLLDAGDRLDTTVGIHVGSGKKLTPLAVAARWGTAAMLRRLLDRGAPLDGSDMALRTLAASSVRDAREKVAILRDLGLQADPDQPPGFHRDTYAYLVAGKVLGDDDFTVGQVRALAELVQRWADDTGLRLVAIPSCDLGYGVADTDDAYAQIAIGLDVAHTSVVDEPATRTLEQLRDGVAAAGDLPAGFWDAITELLPSAAALADEPVALHVISSGALPLASLSFGVPSDRPEDAPRWPPSMERDHEFLLAPLGIAGVHVGGASYDGTATEVVDLSDEAHAARIDEAGDLADHAVYVLRAQYD